MPDGVFPLDQVVRFRLCGARVIAFVVAATLIVNRVDYDILMELLSIGEDQPGGPNAGIGIVAVDV